MSRPLLVDARADAQRLAPGVEAEDLVALDASDLEPEAVRSHVDDGERAGARWRSRGMVRRSVAETRAPVEARVPRASFSVTLDGCRIAAPHAMSIDYLQKILTAKVYDVAIESPLELAPTLSRRLGNRVLLKREDQQPVFSFKLRGAYNKMAHLSGSRAGARRDRGVRRQSRAGRRARRAASSPARRRS